MRKYLAIVFLLLLTATAVSQPGIVSSLLTNFGGLSSGAPTDVSGGTPVDIVDFDFRASQDGLSLIRRKGFNRIGNQKEGAVGGIYRWIKPRAEAQLISSQGTNLYIYSTSKGDWVLINENVLADTCACTNGSATITSKYRKWWWGFSTEDYTQLKIADSLARTIQAIRGDSLIALHEIWAGATGSVACTLVNSNTPSSSSIFTDAAAPKMGLMFEDALHVFTQYERVEYGGASTASRTSSARMTSISPWARSTMEFSLYGNVGLPVGSWVQIGPKKNYSRNIALYVTATTANSMTLRCDTTIYAAIRENADSVWFFKQVTPVAWSEPLKATVTTVSLDSVLAGSNLLETKYQQATLLLNGTFGYPITARRTIYVREPTYIFRWRITNTSAATVSNWRRDTLDYMTGRASSFKENMGDYADHIPCHMDSNLTLGRHLLVTTHGVPGGAVTYIDSTKWAFHGSSLPQDCWTGVQCYAHSEMEKTDTLPAVGNYYRLSTCVNFGQCGTFQCCYSDNPVCSLKVTCRESYTPVSAAYNNASKCFSVSDSMKVFQMNRTTKAAVANSTTRDASWTFPIAVSLGGRFYGTGSLLEPNRVVWTQLNNPDSLAPYPAANFQNIYAGTGRVITALGAEQSVLYVHRPTGIDVCPVIPETGGFTGVFPARSNFGALSMAGLTSSPRGAFFVGLNGVSEFNGQQSELISGPISWFWRDSLDRAMLSQAAIVYDQMHDRLLVSCTKTGQLKNTTTLVYDFLTGLWSRYSIGASLFSSLSYPGESPSLYFSGGNYSVGDIFCQHDSLTKDTGVVSVPYFRTGWLPLGGELTQRASLVEWMIEGRRNATARVGISVFTDGSGTAAYLDSTSAGFAGWGTDRRPFTARVAGERFQFLLRGIGADSLEISGVGITHIPGGKTPWR